MFVRFYSENIDRIYRYVFFRVGQNQTLAEDLVSEIFLKAYEHFADYDPKISKAAWIYRIAHNHLANYYRDTRDHVDIEDVAPTLTDERQKLFLPQLSDRLVVEKALARLSKLERELVTLKYLEGYTYEEMGSILERSGDALKVATHRAMQKLKAICKAQKQS